MSRAIFTELPGLGSWYRYLAESGSVDTDGLSRSGVSLLHESEAERT
jgi:hypothetical protein